MNKIIPRKTLFKKAIPITCITVVLGLGLFLYDYNKDLINNFEFYHIESYVAQVFYGATSSNNNSYLASVSRALIGSDSTIKYNSNKAKSIPVLLYHGITNEPDGSNVLLENFKDQMFALKKAGWETVSIEDFNSFMNGTLELPDKSFLLTFDDGAKDSYYPVDPLLKALDYHAVSFVITKFSIGKGSGSNYYLSERELERMIKSGRWDIQSHSREGHEFYPIDALGAKGHFFGNKLWLTQEGRIEIDKEFNSRVMADMRSAKNDLENNLGITVISFAYPFGDFGQNSANFPEAKIIVPDIAKSMYSLSFYQVWPGKGFSSNYPDQNEFLIKRINVMPDWTADNVLKLLDITREKSIPYFDDFSEYNGWIKTWGIFTLVDDSMVLSSNESNTGSSMFLDGSYLWENYLFESNINWIKGSNVSLLARYKDDENYTACNFSDDKLRIEERLDNKNSVLFELQQSFDAPKNNITLGIRVNENKVECFVNGKSIMYAYYLNPILSNGGIGLKTWDAQINNSEVIVKSVSVKEIK